MHGGFTLHLSLGKELPCREDSRRPHLSEGSALAPIRETVTRLLPASVECPKFFRLKQSLYEPWGSQWSPPADCYSWPLPSLISRPHKPIRVLDPPCPALFLLPGHRPCSPLPGRASRSTGSGGNPDVPWLDAAPLWCHAPRLRAHGASHACCQSVSTELFHGALGA